MSNRPSPWTLFEPEELQQLVTALYSNLGGDKKLNLELFLAAKEELDRKRRTGTVPPLNR